MNGTDNQQTDCRIGNVLIERTTAIDKRQDRHEGDNDREHGEFRSTIDKIRNHVPPWAAALITILAAAAGWFAKG